MRAHHIHLEAPDGTGKTARLTIDGEEVTGVHRATVTVTGDGPATATLAVILPPISFRGEAQVRLDHTTETLLRLLGWTPPAD